MTRSTRPRALQWRATSGHRSQRLTPWIYWSLGQRYGIRSPAPYTSPAPLAKPSVFCHDTDSLPPGPFPRPNSRGLIEAFSSRPSPRRRACFHDPTVVASLKQVTPRQGADAKQRFPRPNSRGLIEASCLRSSTPTTWRGFHDPTVVASLKLFGSRRLRLKSRCFHDPTVVASLKPGNAGAGRHVAARFHDPTVVASLKPRAARRLSVAKLVSTTQQSWPH